MQFALLHYYSVDGWMKDYGFTLMFITILIHLQRHLERHFDKFIYKLTFISKSIAMMQHIDDDADKD